MERDFDFQTEGIVSDLLAAFQEKMQYTHLDSYLTIDQVTLVGGIRFTLLYLWEALLFQNEKIFIENVQWFLSTARNSDVLSFAYEELLMSLKNVLKKHLDSVRYFFAVQVLDHALAMHTLHPCALESYLDHYGVDKQRCQSYIEKVQVFDERGADAVIEEAYAQYGSLRTLYNSIFYPVQYEIGRLWHCGQISVAQEHFCTANTRKLISVLMHQEPLHAELEKVFLGMCVQDEHHSVGIKMVSDFFALSGWKTILLDGNTPMNGVIDVIEEQHVDIVAISTAMPYHFHTVAEYIEKLNTSAQRTSFSILVGGLAFNNFPEIWTSVKADGYSRTAEEAVALAERMVRDRR